MGETQRSATGQSDGLWGDGGRQPASDAMAADPDFEPGFSSRNLLRWRLFTDLRLPGKLAPADEGQTTLRLTSAHAKTGQIQQALRGLRAFFADCRATAEQLGWAALWRKMLSRILGAFLRGRPLQPPPLVPHPT